MLYSCNGATPAPLPFRIMLPDGRSRTDPETFTAAEIAEAGYVPAPAMPEVHDTQHAPEWNGEEWIVRDKTEEEIEAELDAATPMSVTMRQARLALHSAGLLPHVDAFIASMPEQQRIVAEIEWEYGDVSRDSAMVQTIGAALGLDRQAVRDLFHTAAAL